MNRALWHHHSVHTPTFHLASRAWAPLQCKRCVCVCQAGKWLAQATVRLAGGMCVEEERQHDESLKPRGTTDAPLCRRLQIFKSFCVFNYGSKRWIMSRDGSFYSELGLVRFVWVCFYLEWCTLFTISATMDLLYVEASRQWRWKLLSVCVCVCICIQICGHGKSYQSIWDHTQPYTHLILTWVATYPSFGVRFLVVWWNTIATFLYFHVLWSRYDPVQYFVWVK